MIEQEERIQRAKDALTPLRGSAIEEGVAAYLGRLGSASYPSNLDIVAAHDAADSVLKERILSTPWLSAIEGGEPTSKEYVANLRLGFGAVASPLAIPAPQDASELSPARLALAAVVGAVFGMMVLTPLARLLLDMRDTGLFLGAPLGAFLLVLATWQAANSKWLKGILVAALGLAAIGELWGLLTGGSIFSRVWRRLGGRRSGFQRILLYVCVIFVLLFAKRRPRYDRDGYEKTVCLAVEQWVDGAVLAVSLLSGPPEPPPAPDYEKRLCSLVGKIQSLEEVPEENLQFAVQELRQELPKCGVAPLGPKAFEWEENMSEKYETFGLVEPGDPVAVERQPVCLDGTVRKKGLVRKVQQRR